MNEPESSRSERVDGPSDGSSLVAEGGSKVPKTEGILNLIAFLLRSREPVTVELILSQIRGYDDQATRDSLMRRFERDKRVLRDMGVPIQFCPTGDDGAGGYWIPRDSYYLSEIELDDRTHSLLRAIAAASIRQRGGERLHADLNAALVKLGFDAPVDNDVIADGFDAPLDLKVERGIGDQLEFISEAVLRRRQINITYYTIGRDETLKRKVDPYGLGFAGQGWHRGAWYLVGHCHLRNAVRVFRLSRMRGAVKYANPRLTEAEFDLPEGFRVRDHLARPRWELNDLAKALRGDSDATPTTASIRVDPTALAEISQLAPSARRTDHGDGTSVLEFEITARRPFLRFLMRYLGHIDVLSPPELVAELKDLSAQILARYKGRAVG